MSDSPKRNSPNSPDPQVTRRMPDISVTRRMDGGDGSVTRRMEVSAVPATAVRLSPDDFVNDRYRVIEGPLGQRTGEAEVYRCQDEVTDRPVALKLYILEAKPKEQILEELRDLSHPDIVRLLDWGSWRERFYEVMEFCEGGTLADQHASFYEENLSRILYEVVSGLQYLHARGIVHRDIKPTNLFFRDSVKSDVVIGDFGISSYLGAGMSAGKTSTFNRVTFEFAAPELLDDDGEISSKTDYYALGITVLWLVAGKSTFVHPDGRPLNPNKIGELKSRHEIPMPPGSSPGLVRLIRGLTRFNAQQRWGDTQVLQWLNDEEILGDDGLPDDDYELREKAAPYRDCPSITNPREMAARLHEFNAVDGLFRGWIASWVHTHFSAELAKKIAEIEDSYSKDRELGLFKLRFLLDPMLPLEIGLREIRTLSDLADAIDEALKGDMPLHASIAEALYTSRIECWLDATQNLQRKDDLIKAMHDLCARVPSRPLGMFALYYTLRPDAPLILMSDVWVDSLDNLEDILAEHPEAESRVAELLYDGRISEWLRATRPDEISGLQFVEQCVAIYPERHMGATAFRWHCRPALPFPFGTGKEASDSRELAGLINATPQSFAKGADLLRDGWIRTWLISTGRLQNPESFDEIVAHKDSSWGAKLQAVLRLLDRNVAGPKPHVEPAALDLGNIGTDSVRTGVVTISNSGRGFLSGKVKLSHSGGGFAIGGASAIEGQPLTVEITVKPEGLPAGSRQETMIVIDTNGGALQVPVRYVVAAPWQRMIARSMGVGLLWAIALALIRFLFQSVFPTYEHEILDWSGMDQIGVSSVLIDNFTFIPENLFFIFVGLGLIGGFAGWIYWIVKMNRMTR